MGDLGLAPSTDEEDPYGDFWERFVVWHGAYREVEHPKGRGRMSLRADHVAAVIEKKRSAYAIRVSGTASASRYGCSARSG
ncbi:hypothetical protein GCM10020001_112200 [Nonomuraea salmonea]